MRNVYTVKQVNAYIMNMFTQDFMLNRIYIKGEVSNCKYHTSGHLYFSLKDESGTIACVMFAGQRSGLSFRMQEGQQVIVLGSVSVYERDGRYQVYAKEIVLDGAGLLYEKFIKLKKELEEMGMFAPEYKKPIPKYVRTVGVVTAPTGAAVRDIINITRRRNPYVQILLYPALVQGDGASESVVRGIRALEEAKVDVMSFNIRLDHVADSLNNWKYRKDAAAQMIAYYTPDVVGMQEVLKNQLDDLKNRLPQYTALGVGRADGKEKGEYCSLFYKTDRFDLVKSGNFGLSETPDSIGIKGWDAACERIVTWAVLKDKVSGKELAAFNTHFDHIGKVARRESAVLLLAKIREIASDLPVVITGDFNGTVDSDPISVLTEGGMQNTYFASDVVYGPAWSFHDFGRIPVEERQLIDFIFVNGQVVANKFRVIADKPDNGYLSDHAPILANLTIR